MELTEEQLKTFKDKGFIVVKGFFGKPVMDKVSACVDGLTQLLGEPPVQFKDKVNYKLPGCRPPAD